MASPRERDHRGELTRPSTNAVQPSSSAQVPRSYARRHHFHDVPPWPNQRYHDYIYVDRGGWWPRWFPYWDPSWYAYWWYLYDYYGGDAYPEYAEHTRDALLRQHGPQWGLAVDNYGSTQVGNQSYDSRSEARATHVAAYRGVALDAATRIHNAMGSTLVGYRDSPWGSEVTVFGTRAGLERWVNEQSRDYNVRYAAAFDLGVSSFPCSEVAR